MKPANWPADLPWIDPEIQFVGASFLRTLNTDKLRNLGSKMLVITDEQHRPLAVMISHEAWTDIQALDATPAAALEAQKELTND